MRRSCREENFKIKNPSTAGIRYDNKINYKLNVDNNI